jgi:DNA polymerase III delta prime subunit|tara:strand:- start:2712 stop:3656 length:945 start_codon:yes stop_codon:yes gene_type:complete
MQRDDFLWVEKYRPTKISDCVLPSDLYEPFSDFVDQGKLPNLILAGGPGTGKTTAAKALCEETQTDYLMVNGSDEGRSIDTVRTTLNQFCSSVSMTGNRKAIIMDEADYMNPDSVQPALRGFIERFGNNVSFLFTANYPNRIIDPIHSRCAVFDFVIPKNEIKKIAEKYLELCGDILSKENVEYENKVLAELIMKHFPDFRRVLNELQRYSTSGRIDTGILTSLEEVNVGELVSSLRGKKFSDMRKWANSNIDTDTAKIFRKLYDSLSGYLKPQSVPQAVLIIADYQYKSAFVADQEINLVACLTEIMVECEFK